MNRRLFSLSTLLSFLGLQPSSSGAEEAHALSLIQVRDIVMLAIKNESIFDNVEADQNTDYLIKLTSGGSRSEFDVTNLFSYLNANPDANLDEAVRHWISGVKDIASGAAESDDVGNYEDALVLVLRSKEYVEQVVKRGAKIVSTPFVGSLYLVYMLDRPNALLTFTEKQRNGRDIDQLHALALSNVRSRLKNLSEKNISEGASVFYLDGNEILSPSLILLDEFWDKVSVNFPGDVIMAVPRVDLLLLCRADAPNAHLIARKVVEGVFQDDFNLLTDMLLIRRNGKIEQLEE